MTTSVTRVSVASVFESRRKLITSSVGLCAIFEDEARNEQVPAADAQVRLAGDQHLALGLRGQRESAW